MSFLFLNQRQRCIFSCIYLYQYHKLPWLQKKVPYLTLACVPFLTQFQLFAESLFERCRSLAAGAVSVGIKPLTLALLIPCCVVILFSCSLVFSLEWCLVSKSRLRCLFCHVWRWLTLTAVCLWATLVQTSWCPHWWIPISSGHITAHWLCTWQQTFPLSVPCNTACAQNTIACNAVRNNLRWLIVFQYMFQIGDIQKPFTHIYSL